MPEGSGAEAGRVSVERRIAVTDRSATGISEVSQFRPSPTYSRGRGHSPPRSALLRTVQDSRAQHITNARAQTPRSSPDTHVCVSVTLLASPARPAQPSQAAALAARHRSFPLRILLDLGVHRLAAIDAVGHEAAAARAAAERAALAAAIAACWSLRLGPRLSHDVSAGYRLIPGAEPQHGTSSLPLSSVVWSALSDP